MKARLHYFYKLKGTQNKENEGIKYSSPIPFCPTYLLWAMKIFDYKLQLFILNSTDRPARRVWSLLPVPQRYSGMKCFMISSVFCLCSTALYSA